MRDFRPTRLEILPTIIKNLIIINVLVFFAQNTFAGVTSTFSVENYFALHAWKSDLFQPWQMITHMFLHANFWHLFGNMLALWMIGSVLENLWGPKNFLLFYLLCGLGAAAIHLLILSYRPDASLNIATMGASGGVFGILMAFVYLFPNTLFYIYFFFPIKAKWLGILYFGSELFMALQNNAGDNVARWAHVGGAIVGFILVYIWKKTDRSNRWY